MSHPILYSATETKFDHNGFGILGDCASCEVTEEANGIFELAMAYPMDGIHYEDIVERAIIKAKADQFRDPQLFRVYAISKPMSGIVTVLAEHISYDLSGIPVEPFSADSVAGALSLLKSNAVVDCPFEFWTDKSTSGKFLVPTPASIRSRLGGVAGSILDVYGGEYEFDNYTVKLHSNRGMNRGVSIRYGKNLTDIKQEQNCTSVATGVYPYWAGDVDGSTVVVELPEKIVRAAGTYNFVKIRTLDLSSDFQEQPNVDQLREKAEAYVKNNNIGIPKVSLTVSFAQLEQYDEYKNLKLLEQVSLFDTVNVEFPALGVSATAKAVKLVYDVIFDRVKSVTLGSVRANIADKIANQENKIDSVKTEVKSDIRKAQEAATEWLTNGK
jgi:phage minor structural protein